MCSLAAPGKRTQLIRQAISCDICGVDMQQTNHWFIARQQGDELRITAWNTRIRSRVGALHLCGQTCLHKLLDEFLARGLASRATGVLPQNLQLALNAPAAGTDSAPRSARPPSRAVTAITAPRTGEYDSSANLLPTPDEIPVVLTPLPPTSITSRSPHADAWKREQARIQSEAPSRSSRSFA